jgi:hypothetical protein
MECLDLRVGQLEKKQTEIDEQILDEVHDLRGLLNYFSLEMQHRRLKKCP